MGMTYEEKRDFLYQYRDAKREMQAYMADLEFWRSVGASMSAGGGCGSGSSGGSKVETASVHIADLEQEMLQGIQLCKERQKDVRNALKRMKTGKYKALLCDIYIAGMSKFQAANERGTTVRAINYMHRRALDKLDI